MPFTEVPQRTLELWNACEKHEWLNPLLKARSPVSAPVTATRSGLRACLSLKAAPAPLMWCACREGAEESQTGTVRRGCSATLRCSVPVEVPDTA